MRSLKKHIRIWWILTGITSQKVLTSRFGTVVFMLGKILRFGFFGLFLLLLQQKTTTIAGYSLWQIIFFYATFNLVDVLPQFFMREVYRFRWNIVTGAFDYILTKPISPLFRSLFGGSDILDLAILFISIFFVFFSAAHLGDVSGLAIAFYIALIANAFLIALAIHIFVLAVGILTTEVDNTLWLYRDLTQMGRVPIDIYLEPVRGFLTFVVPVGIMITFPAKALMGILSPFVILLSFFIGGLFFILARQFWNYALRHYASASS